MSHIIKLREVTGVYTKLIASSASSITKSSKQLLGIIEITEAGTTISYYNVFSNREKILTTDDINEAMTKYNCLT